MAKMGPFFHVGGKLIYDAKPIEECEKRGDKYDNPYSHEELFETRVSREEDYIDYPRGRVIFDGALGECVIYVDKCIRSDEIISEITKAFEIEKYRIEEDEHYRCKNCVGDLFDW